MSASVSIEEGHPTAEIDRGACVYVLDLEIAPGTPAYMSGHPDNWHPGEGPDWAPGDCLAFYENDDGVPCEPPELTREESDAIDRWVLDHCA